MKNKNIFKMLSMLFFLLSSIFAMFDFRPIMKSTKALVYEPVPIGILYSIQNVSTQTKVYLDNETYSLVQEAGRTIHMELDDGGFDPGEPKGPIQPTYRFYYYATPTEPIITGKTVMKNDIDSILVALRYLEQEADWFLSGQTMQVKNNAILSFIRCVREDYTRRLAPIPSQFSWLFGNEINMFQIVAGNHLETSFISDVVSLNPGGLKIHYFFSSLILEGSYNSTDYGFCPNEFINKHLGIYDEIDTFNHIDFLHLVAAFDSIVLGTGNQTSSLPYNLIMEANSFRHVGSWAGDLQQAGKSMTMSNAFNPNFSFSSVLNGDCSGFGYPDYYADMDAQIMATNQNLSNMVLSDVFEDYYQSLWDETIDRKGEFVTCVASMVGGNGTDLNKFKAIAYEFLKLNINGTDISNNNNFYHDTAKFYFLRYDDGSYPNNFIRNALAEDFYDWFAQN